MSKFSKDKGYQAFRILQFTFVIAPIIAGLDKFFYLLTNWSQYLAPLASRLAQHHDREFMMAAGVIEIIAGLGIIFKPRVFAYIIALWLLAIIINLLILGSYFDIVLKDLGLFLSAVALAKLSEKYTQ